MPLGQRPASLILYAAESWDQDIALGRFDFFDTLAAKGVWGREASLRHSGAGCSTGGDTGM